eukprot:c14983_g1_i1.p1 GENE.c14983_g1_i1~~c14983_g1_i1.p1  ORF type:complete len:744 (-),score=192.07 c14983_g1_i1:138-2369(-)
MRECVVCVLLCGVVAALALDSTQPKIDKSFPSAPLEKQVFAIDVPEEDTSVAISNAVPPPPSVKRDVVVWDESTMPHPDSSATMPESPDLAFSPPLNNEPEIASTNQHTTHRNMVMPGLDMIRIDKAADISQNPSDAVMQSVTDKLEALDHDMPITPALANGPECSDAAAVAEIGTTPEFSRTPMLPTKEVFGTSVVSNSYKDFISGLPKDLRASSHHGVVVTRENPSDQLNPPLPEAAVPSINVTVAEGHSDMSFKFTVKFKFLCEKDISRDFEEQYGKILRQATSLGSHVPLGNVEIDASMDKDGIVALDIGAPTVQGMRDEISSLREYVKDGSFKEALKALGFANCASSIVSIADNLQDASTMPEATIQDQLGPPGGQEEAPLSPEEQRNRQRAREAMTYGEYVKPGRLNITRLQPHIFHNITLPPTPQHYNVVGRLKFIFTTDDHVKKFPVLYSGLVRRGLTQVTKLPIGAVRVEISGALPPLSRRHSSLATSLLELSSELEVGELPYALLDFEIPAETLPIARSLTTAVVKAMSDTKKGLRAFLRSTGNFPEDGEVTLLFIEIHSPEGAVVDEDEESCSNEEVVDEEIEVQPSPVPVTPRDMSNPANCTEPQVIHATPDDSVNSRVPDSSHDDWPAMNIEAVDNAHMNKPGLDGRDRSDSTLLLQVLRPTHPSTQALEKTSALELVQLEGPSIHEQGSSSLMVSGVKTESNAAENNGMPEADELVNAPAGGFPVPDLD